MSRRTNKEGPGPKTRIAFHEAPGKREIQSRLKWLIYFVNSDIQVLSLGEFLKLLDEVLSFFYGDQLDARLRRILPSDTDRNRRAVSQIQSRTEGYLRDIVSTENTIFRDGENRCTGDYALVTGDVVIKGNQVKLVYRKNLRPYYEGVRLDFGYDIRPEQWEKTIDQEYVDKELAGIPDDEKEKHSFFSNCYDSDVQSSVLLSLVPLLENFPLECIRRCSGCGKYFTSTRKKKSPLCHFCYKRRSMPNWLRKPENRKSFNEYIRNRRKGVGDETPTQIRERLRVESKDGGERNGE